MTNAELFKKVFGIYAEEFWAYPEEKMLDWLTSPVASGQVSGQVVQCKECRFYQQSEADPSRKMCYRKDVDGWFVCYDFFPTDYCSYGEREK